MKTNYELIYLMTDDERYDAIMKVVGDYVIAEEGSAFEDDASRLLIVSTSPHIWEQLKSNLGSLPRKVVYS